MYSICMSFRYYCLLQNVELQQAHTQAETDMQPTPSATAESGPENHGKMASDAEPDLETADEHTQAVSTSDSQ